MILYRISLLPHRVHGEKELAITRQSDRYKAVLIIRVSGIKEPDCIRIVDRLIGLIEGDVVFQKVGECFGGVGVVNQSLLNRSLV